MQVLRDINLDALPLANRDRGETRKLPVQDTGAALSHLRSYTLAVGVLASRTVAGPRPRDRKARDHPQQHARPERVQVMVIVLIADRRGALLIQAEKPVEI